MPAILNKAGIIAETVRRQKKEEVKKRRFHSKKKRYSAADIFTTPRSAGEGVP